GRCIEHAEVCSPIILENEVLGVIGLVALSSEQKEKLNKNKHNLIAFLNKMGEMLSTKVQEINICETQGILLNQIETVINTIDEAIIALDIEGNIHFKNKNVEEILNRDEIKNLIDKILKEYKNYIIKFKRDYRNIQLDLGEKRILVTIKPVVQKENVYGLVVSLKNMKDINKIIRDVTLINIDTTFDKIIGVSNEFLNVIDMAKKSAKTDSTVLILGESGTGKELFARAIHNESKRKNKPFVAVNCAAIPESLLESELFGFEEGAFTGAKKGGKIGKFELANGGTIFLDEIGDMPLHLQVKLLRVLQERRIERIGSNKGLDIDIRIIAATHKNLEEMVLTGEFRQDLYYRLNVIPIKIPPLRQRKEDIKILMKHILKKCSVKINKNIKEFEGRVYECFLNYNWPGNVRELENTIEYLVNMESKEYISFESLPERFKVDEKIDESIDLKLNEKKLIEKALKMYNSRDEAAKALGIGRATLFRKIKEYNLN
ncbi:MAG: sigma 54-interacting transcriptional regulator, partial [Clostridiales bacterium]|nr:sigma 54-interacting transcriptional regulator [Clostridiales bacterium]